MASLKAMTVSTTMRGIMVISFWKASTTGTQFSNTRNRKYRFAALQKYAFYGLSPFTHYHPLPFYHGHSTSFFTHHIQWLQKLFKPQSLPLFSFLFFFNSTPSPTWCELSFCSNFRFVLLLMSLEALHVLILAFSSIHHFIFSPTLCNYGRRRTLVNSYF